MLFLFAHCTLLVVACVLAVVAIFWSADGVECDASCSCNKSFCSQTGFDDVVSPDYQRVNDNAQQLVNSSESGVVAVSDLITLRSKCSTHMATLQITDGLSSDDSRCIIQL
jgi:hypothetical protein